MRKIFAAIILIALCQEASAQTSPGLSYGQVLTAGQWNALFAGKQDVLGFTPLNVSGGVMTGRLITAAPSSTTSGLNLIPGTTPGSPADGDLWFTTSGVFAQVNGSTINLTGAASTSFAGTSPITVSFPSGIVTYACATCGVTGSPLSQFAATTSAQLRGILSDETGTGLAVFQNGALGTPTATSLALGGASIGSNALAVTGTSALGITTGTSLALGGATIGSNALAITGTFAFSAGGSFGGALTGITTLASGAHTITSASASALAVGPNGATNPVLLINASTASQASGLSILGQAAGVGTSVSVIDSATNSPLALNAKGSGQIILGNTSTGSVVVGGGGGGVTISSALTYGGVTLANSVVGTGSMVLGTAPSISSLTVTTAFTATGLVTYADMAAAAISTQANYFAGASNVLVPASGIYTPEIVIAFAASQTIDASTFINGSILLTANMTSMTVSNIIAGKSYQIRLIQDGTGAHLFSGTWPTAFKFSGGITPTLSTAANAVDALELNCTATSYCIASMLPNAK